MTSRITIIIVVLRRLQVRPGQARCPWTPEISRTANSTWASSAACSRLLHPGSVTRSSSRRYHCLQLICFVWALLDRQGEVFCDVGSGNGRLVLAAATMYVLAIALSLRGSNAIFSKGCICMDIHFPHRVRPIPSDLHTPCPQVSIGSVACKRNRNHAGSPRRSF